MGLDENRAARGADAGEGGREGLSGADGISGEIDLEALDAVAGGALPELGVLGELFRDGSGVGVAVVLDDKEDR